MYYFCRIDSSLASNKSFPYCSSKAHTYFFFFFMFFEKIITIFLLSVNWGTLWWINFYKKANEEDFLGEAQAQLQFWNFILFVAWKGFLSVKKITFSVDSISIYSIWGKIIESLKQNIFGWWRHILYCNL